MRNFADWKWSLHCCHFHLEEGNSEDFIKYLLFLTPSVGGESQEIPEQQRAGKISQFEEFVFPFISFKSDNDLFLFSRQVCWLSSRG